MPGSESVAVGGPRLPLRVLESFPEPGPQTNPYISQLLDALRSRDDLVVSTFSWRRAFAARFDVFHVHWPDALLQARSPLRRAVKSGMFALLLLRLRLARIAVVRTVHNSDAHERDAAADLLDRALDRLTRGRVLLTPAAAPLATLIPHGHYRDWLRPYPVAERRDGRLLFVGHLRPYKGVPELIAAFGGVADPRASLVVAGAPRDPGLTSQILAAAAADPRLITRFGYATDEEFVRLVTEAQLVVLPYRRLENSGVALAALSLDRPVLVPRTPSTAALADEVGDEWVLLFSPPLVAATLNEALARTSTPPRGRPRFVDREWSNTGDRHRAVFAGAVLGGRRRGRT